MTLLHRENPVKDYNYPGGPIFLNDRGMARYHELRGFQQALALFDADAAAKLGDEFVRICDFVSARTLEDFASPEGEVVQVPSSAVWFGDDGSFACFTFVRYIPSPLDAPADRLARDPWRDDIFRDRRRGVTFGWRFLYNGAVIYRGPRKPEEWSAWRTFTGHWWSSHT